MVFKIVDDDTMLSARIKVIGAGGAGGNAVNRMIEESESGKDNCLWFTTLISKSATLPHVYRTLKYSKAKENRTIEMSQGQKKSRFLAWTFMDKEQQREWWQRKPR